MTEGRRDLHLRTGRRDTAEKIRRPPGGGASPGRPHETSESSNDRFVLRDERKFLKSHPVLIPRGVKASS